MREILFRGKAACGAWVQGDLIHRKIWQSEFEVIRVDDSGFDNYQEYEVATDTIGQYTGLTDKNGNKIFEGDIVDITYPETIVRNALVTYVGASFYGDNGNDLWVFDDYISFEVIGNIHDNKELLEVK